MSRLALLAVAVAALGCSSGGGTGGNAIDPFLGTWSVGGNANYTTTQTVPYSGNPSRQAYGIVFGAGGSHDMISIDTYGCKLEWSLSGKNLRMDAPQSCMVNAGMAMTIRVDTSTFQLTPVDGLTLSAAGSVTGMVGTTLTSADAVGTFTKAP